MTPYLFLDFDGVLTNSDHAEGRGPDPKGNIEVRLRHRIDPQCLRRLNVITDMTGAQVVLSTNWRHYAPWPEIAEALRDMGMTGRILGRTPLTSEQDFDVFARYQGRPPAFDEPYPRGYEIQQWIDENTEILPTIAILDDDDDMEPLCPRLVHTDFKTGGLQLGHVRRAISMLES